MRVPSPCESDRIISALEAHQLHCTTAEYHAHPALSCSQFLSAGLYTETEEFWMPHLFAEQRKIKSKALDEGTLVHAAYYELESFHELYAIRPLNEKGNLVACNTEAYKQWEVANTGKIHFSPKDMPDVLGMAEALHRADESGCLKNYRSVTRRISCEANYLVRCPVTGLDLRIKPDELRIHQTNGVLYCDDLKTSKDLSPTKFRRACTYDFHYYRRAAWYRYALRLITGEDCIFRMVVVESEKPYLVALYHVSEEKLYDYECQNTSSLEALARCIETGNFQPAWLKGAYEL